MSIRDVPDNWPVIVGAGQVTEPLAGSDAPLTAPMQLAANAGRMALADAGGDAHAACIDTVATIRLFSDSAPAWACPFGRSDNPPDTVARSIGATPERLIYSNAGGTQPLNLLAELMAAILAGEYRCALLTGAEAIASQRLAQRQGLAPDWSDPSTAPLDERFYAQRFASPEELASGMSLPAHYYALIENLRGHRAGRDAAGHARAMARLMAPLSEVAAGNPYAFFRERHSAARLLEQDRGNYPVCHPYSKLLMAQDSVNQGAAVLVMSAGLARELGIDPARWVFLQGYAEGEEDFLARRPDPASSPVMAAVLHAALDSAAAGVHDLDLLDIYSCFPCAVDAACEALALPVDGSMPLTITGGLPFFGGPGNNYVTHSLAEMVNRVRRHGARGLVTANGGILSKHAAAVLAASPRRADGSLVQPPVATPIKRDESRGASRALATNPEAGKVTSFTVIYGRDGDHRAVVLGETDNGERFLARSEAQATVAACHSASPIGRQVALAGDDGVRQFSFADA